MKSPIQLAYYLSKYISTKVIIKIVLQIALSSMSFPTICSSIFFILAAHSLPVSPFLTYSMPGIRISGTHFTRKFGISFLTGFVNDNFVLF